MPDQLELNRPWLIAVWPGMANVAVSAGYYLMAKLGMQGLAEFSAHEVFDVDHECSQASLRSLASMWLREAVRRNDVPTPQ